MKPPIENIELIRKAKKLSREVVADKLKLTENNYGKIERGEVGLTLDRLYELAAIFKMKPEEILAYGKPQKGNITYVPIEAQPAFLEGREKGDAEYKTYHLPFIEGKDLYMIDAIGDSMAPTISHGDYIVVESVSDLKAIQFGRAFIIVTKKECIVKRLYSHKNVKKFVLKSDNQMYEPYEINRNDIIALWLVKDYLLRTNLSLRNSFLFTESSDQEQSKKGHK
ncbi:MAG: LexA family transcriptional regulator [Bacteroidia bacterium]|jgi:transcriptional regulator with XRE-family HTH domain